VARGESRQRFIEATSELLREKGFTATGLSDVIERSGAPKGSLYFHFPNGKDELFEAAIDDTSSKTCEAMKAALASAPSVQAGVDLIVTFLSGELTRSEFRAGCPLGTVAAEAPEGAPRVTAGVQQAFERYHGAIRDRLLRGGLKAKRAEQLADFLLASIEGAILLAKAKRSLQPLNHCRREITLLLEREKVS
jgi:TetR/AcrR family transcriptional repressor of lmrAB and yxaGH operons